MSTYLASCSTVILTHDITMPNYLSTSSPHTGKINSVCYNHNSRVLASSGDDGNIVLSHTETFEKLAVLEPLQFSASPISSIAFTSKSDMVGCGSLDGVVRIWDLRKKEVSASFNHHTDSVSCVAWNYNDQQIVSSSMSGEIMVHSLLTKVSVGSFKQRGSAGIKVIQFSPFKKNYLGAGSENGSVYIWDVNLKQVSCAFPSYHNSPVTGLAFSSVNHMLMCTSGLDQRINFYDTQEKKIVKSIDVDAPLTCIAFATDGHTLAGGTLYGTILVYDLRMASSPKCLLKGHEGNVINWLDFAKSRDLKSRQQRENSREARDNTLRPEEANAINNTSAVTVNRFRTLEEIKMEAKLRVEQKRRERLGTDQSYKLDQVLIPKNEVNNNDKSPLLKEIGKESKEAAETKGKELNFLEKYDIKEKNDLIKEKNDLIKEKNDFFKEKNEAERKTETEKSFFAAEKFEKKERFERNEKLEKNERFDKNEKERNGGPQKNDRIEVSERVEKNFIDEEVEIKRGGLAEMMLNRIDLQDETIFELKEDIQNLHVEIIRQFMIQINEIKNLLAEYSVANSNLLSENKYLKEENERLKKTSY